MRAGRWQREGLGERARQAGLGGSLPRREERRAAEALEDEGAGRVTLGGEERAGRGWARRG